MAQLKEVGFRSPSTTSAPGYAILSRLKSLPVDVLKIDAAFVTQPGGPTPATWPSSTIIGLAEALVSDWPPS